MLYVLVLRLLVTVAVNVIVAKAMRVSSLPEMLLVGLLNQINIPL